MRWRVGSILFGTATAVGLALTACGGAAASPFSAPPPTPTPPYSPATNGPATPAAVLRIRWNLLLQEHQLLAFKSTDAVLAGHTDEAGAYEDQLSRNGSDVGDLIAASYGGPARDRFNAIWVAHDRALVDAAQAAGARDTASMQRAMTEETTRFVPDLASLLATLTGLPQRTLAGAAAQQVTGTTAITSAQAARDYSGAYAILHSARARLGKLADSITAATVARRPSAFPGDPDSRAAALAVELNTLLQEHAYEVTASGDALLGGRSAELGAATQALKANAADLARTVDSIFGSEAQHRFITIWSAQDTDFRDYADAVAGGDLGGEQRALQDLNQIGAPRLANFLSDLLDTPPDSFTPRITDEIAALTAVLDAQGAQRAGDAAQKDRFAAARIGLIAGGLATAITARAPDRFA